MYKELVDKIEADLSEFKNNPELDRRYGECRATETSNISYVIYRGNKEGYFDIKIYNNINSDYTFKGTKDVILARLKEVLGQ